MSQKQVRYIIIGQGIAGTLLAWFLLKKGETFLVIDNANPDAASKVAAGIIHPITGRRIVKSWMADTLIPFARQTYEELEEFLGQKILPDTKIIELLTTAKEINDWSARSEEQGAGEWIEEVKENLYDKYLQPFSNKILIRNSFCVDTASMVESFRKVLENSHEVLTENFDLHYLEEIESGVRYKDYTAEKIIFCDGAAAAQNPYWKHLPFIPAKGEVLIIKAGMTLDHVLNRKIFIQPIGDGLFKAGATYEWDFKNALPTVEAKDFLVAQLKSILKIPFEVVDHYAAIRPATKDRRPFIGLHPEHKTIGIFNGLGTKGCMLAPYFANQFTDFLTGEKSLMKEVDAALK